MENSSENVCICGYLSTENGDPKDPDSAHEFQLQIECDICHTWYHAKCVKLGRIGVQTVDKYHCPRCEPLCGPSVYKPKTNEHRHDPTEEDANEKPPQVGTKVFYEKLASRHFFEASGEYFTSVSEIQP